MKERLQKFIAGAGVSSRRRAEELITSGYVAVNGKIITRLGTTIDPDHDKVTVNGRPVARPTTHRYIALNKPYAVVCSKIAQGRGERTVYHLVPKSADLAIAGRLDKDSEGLVILTNDGDLVNRLTHPRYQHEKEYVVDTIKPLDDAAMNRLRRGVRLKEGLAVMDTIEHLHGHSFRVIIHQGWNRQIRRMIGEVRTDVVKLKRVRMGKYELGTLPPGEWLEVKHSDIL